MLIMLTFEHVYVGVFFFLVLGAFFFFPPEVVLFINWSLLPGNC